MRESRSRLVPGGGEASFSVAEIPEQWRRLLDECLKPTLEGRFKTVPEAMQALPSKAGHAEVSSANTWHISRRKMMVLGASAGAGAAVGVWLETPIPRSRFSIRTRFT